MALTKRDLAIAAVAAATATVTLATPLVVTLLGYEAQARVAMARPTVVATVDLNAVINALNEAADWRTTLRQKEEEIRGDLQKKKGDLEALSKQVEAAPEAQKDALNDDLRMQNLETQSWLAISERQLDAESALMWQSLYRNIKKVVGEMAVAEGYDIVLVNDSMGDVLWDRQSQVPATQQVMGKIAGRRMLYSSPEVDITQKLIVRMNNAHNAATAPKP